MKAVAQLDEMRLLARGLHVHGAAVDHRVVGDDADDLAVHACQAGDHRLAERRLDLEERVPIDDGLHKAAHVVGPPAVVRYDAQKGVLTAFHGIGGGNGRRQLPDILRQIGEEPAD